MNKNNVQNKKVMDFLMDDGPWLITNTDKDQKIENKGTIPEAVIPEKKGTKPEPEITGKKDTFTDIDKVKEIKDKTHEISEEEDKEFGEVDYAILKSITYGFKDIKKISKALQIRTLIVEKHVHDLIKNGFLKYFQHAVITSKGNDAISDFETSKPEELWKPIDEFILSVIENQKDKNIKIQKMIDLVLLVSIVILIILVIYFGLFS